MNELVATFGLGAWKAVAASLLLPPTPLLLLALASGTLLWKRRGGGWFCLSLALIGLWLSCCDGFAERMGTLLLRPPPALAAARLKSMEHDARAGKAMAIVVLGGGHERAAPEYGGQSNLGALSLERLRYGVWLGRTTGIPIGFSGGAGFGREGQGSEAQAAARIAASEFGRPLRWTEDESRDTRENAARTLALLEPAAVREIVLVTHDWHMPRAVRDFEEASHGRIRITPAPIGLAPRVERPALRWMPTGPGFQHVHQVLHEALGLLAGS